MIAVPHGHFTGIFFTLGRSGENRLSAFGDHADTAFKDRPEVADVTQIFFAVLVTVNGNGIQIGFIHLRLKTDDAFLKFSFRNLDHNGKYSSNFKDFPSGKVSVDRVQNRP